MNSTTLVPCVDQGWGSNCWPLHAELWAPVSWSVQEGILTPLIGQIKPRGLWEQTTCFSLCVTRTTRTGSTMRAVLYRPFFLLSLVLLAANSKNCLLILFIYSLHFPPSLLPLRVLFCPPSTNHFGLPLHLCYAYISKNNLYWLFFCLCLRARQEPVEWLTLQQQLQQLHCF